MTRWAYLVNGVVAGLATSDAPPTPEGWWNCGAQSPQWGWRYDGTNYIEPKPQKITATQFLNRFTDAERAALFSAAMASQPMLQFVVTMAATTSIDLTDPAVAAGVNSLVGGILTAPRAAAILDH